MSAGTTTPKLEHVPILPIERIKPSPENAKMYGVVDPKDPEIRALADSIAERGIQEPLVVTEDYFVLSGHRRLTAAWLADLRKVPVRVYPARRADLGVDEYLQLLVTHNRQRVKTLDQKVREEVVLVDRESAYQSLLAHRAKAAKVEADTMDLGSKKQRAVISGAKAPLLEAVQEIVYARKRFWPLSDRAIHYRLLNDPPLIHASKPNSTYDNTKRSYKALVDLLTRARLKRAIPMQSIDDSTRPVTVWAVHNDPQTFLRAELDGLFRNYARNLMQSQPNHVEIVAEKITVESIVRPIAARFTLPLTITRGQCSLPPRRKIAKRFKDSGKERLVLLVVSDFDPDGESIAQAVGRSLRDDFRIRKIDVVKAALTAQQVEDFDLQPDATAKKGSAKYKEFVKKYGKNVFELEAIDEEDLQDVLTAAVESVIDVEAFNHEVDMEKVDAAYLDTMRRQVLDFLREQDDEEPTQ